MDHLERIRILEAQLAMVLGAANRVLLDIDDDGVAERDDLAVLALRKAVETGPAAEFQSVLFCARRVHTKFGADSDWSEWKDLGVALNDLDNWPFKGDQNPA